MNRYHNPDNHSAFGSTATFNGRLWRELNPVAEHLFLYAGLTKSSWKQESLGEISMIAQNAYSLLR